MSDVKDQIKLDYLSGVPPKKLAENYSTSMNTIKSWIKRYGWSKMKKQGAPSRDEGAPSDVQGAPRKRKRGGQPGNKNAVGHGAPKGNQNATKHGLFSRYLPEDTREIFFSLDWTCCGTRSSWHTRQSCGHSRSCMCRTRRTRP